jgi:hypothetical protein
MALQGARSPVLGPDTDVINGQLLPIQNREARFPFGYVGIAQRVPNITPTIPPMIGQTGGTTMTDTEAAGLVNPWSLFHSPLPWAIGMLIVGLLILRFVHWAPMR